MRHGASSYILALVVGARKIGICGSDSFPEAQQKRPRTRSFSEKPCAKEGGFLGGLACGAGRAACGASISSARGSDSGCVRADEKQTRRSSFIKRSLTAADCGRHLFATDTHHWCSRLCTPRAENWLRSPVRVLVSPALPPLLEAQLAALSHRRILRIPVMIPITDDRLQVFRC